MLCKMSIWCPCYGTVFYWVFSLSYNWINSSNNNHMVKHEHRDVAALSVSSVRLQSWMLLSLEFLSIHQQFNWTKFKSFSSVWTFLCVDGTARIKLCLKCTLIAMKTSICGEKMVIEINYTLGVMHRGMYLCGCLDFYSTVGLALDFHSFFHFSFFCLLCFEYLDMTVRF